MLNQDETIFEGNDPIITSVESMSHITIEKAEELFLCVDTETKLATIFAIVENKLWLIEDQEYDYEEGTKEYKAARESTRRWLLFAKKIEEKILSILRSEGVSIPQKGKIVVLEPFMRRNGYRDGTGWWIRLDC